MIAGPFCFAVLPPAQTIPSGFGMFVSRKKMLGPMKRYRNGMDAKTRVLSRFLASSLIAAGLIASGNLYGDELSEKIAFCNSCHGESGRPAVPDIPIIAGQQRYYLLIQLRDYQSGRRANPIMSGVVQDLDKSQMEALAKFYSSQTWNGALYHTPDGIDGQATSALGAGLCVQCHLGGYEGSGSVPRLAGQQPAYLERTMLELKNKLRQNAPDKGALFRTYSEEDIRLMSRYLGGL